MSVSPIKSTPPVQLAAAASLNPKKKALPTKVPTAAIDKAAPAKDSAPAAQAAPAKDSAPAASIRIDVKA